MKWKSPDILSGLRISCIILILEIFYLRFVMQDPYSSIEEISMFESFVITSHLSSYHHKMMYSLAKDFKKIVKNDSKEAFKINAKVYHATIAGKPLSQKTSELFDDIVNHPQKINQTSKFI